MRHHHSPGIRGQLMWFLCCICLFLLALVWFLSTQLLEPLYTKHIEKQLTTQAENITADLDKALAEGEALSSWSFGRLSVNTSFFDRLATQLYASGSLNSFCVDISDSTMRTIYKIENQSYCNLHETLLSDSANNDMIVSTAVAMRKKCRTTGGFVQTLNPPRLSGSAQLLQQGAGNRGEFALQGRALIHADKGRSLILGEAVVHAAGVDDGGVDYRIVPLNVLEGRSEGDKIPGVGSINAVAIPFGHVGCKDDQEGLLFLIPDSLRSPGAAGAFRRQGNGPGARPVSQIIRVPHQYVPAAAVDSAVPVMLAVVYAQVGADQIILAGERVLYQKGIAHAFFADGRNENGFAAVQILPVQSVPADAEENLLAVVNFLGKVYKDVGSHSHMLRFIWNQMRTHTLISPSPRLAQV